MSVAAQFYLCNAKMQILYYTIYIKCKSKWKFICSFFWWPPFVACMLCAVFKFTWSIIAGVVSQYEDYKSAIQYNGRVVWKSVPPVIIYPLTYRLLYNIAKCLIVQDEGKFWEIGGMVWKRYGLAELLYPQISANWGQLTIQKNNNNNI